jgi:hypothetical protein
MEGSSAIVWSNIRREHGRCKEAHDFSPADFSSAEICRPDRISGVNPYSPPAFLSLTKRDGFTIMIHPYEHCILSNDEHDVLVVAPLFGVPAGLISYM